MVQVDLQRRCLLHITNFYQKNDVIDLIFYILKCNVSRKYLLKFVKFEAVEKCKNSKKYDNDGNDGRTYNSPLIGS